VASSRRSRDIRVLTAALLALLLVVVWGLVGLLIHLQYADADRALARRAQALAGTLAHHVGLRTASLEALGDLLLARADATVAEAPDLARLMSELEPPPEVRRITLMDREGRLIAATGAAPQREDLAVESLGRPAAADGRRIVISADASRLLALAAGPTLRSEGVALLVRGGDRALSVYPATGSYAGEAVWDAPFQPRTIGHDGVDRHWASSLLSNSTLELRVGIASDETYRELRERASGLIAAAAIESGVAVALALFVLAQARRRDRLLMRLEFGRHRLRVANTAKMRFLQSISHELRTPLNGILCTSELMVQLAMNDEQAEVIEIISQSASDLANMIDMLIDVAELQAGSARIVSQPVQVLHIIDAAGKKCLSAIWSRGGTLTQRCAPDLPATLRLDPTRLERILRTLLDAAANVYENPAITLQAGMGGTGGTAPMLLLRVAVTSRVVDDGVAAPATMQARAMPGDAAREAAATESLKATLGVLLLQDLVVVLGGRLTASTPRPGEQIVEVLLPVEPATVAADAADAAHASGSAPKKVEP
jgi:signal transduction histidine kinase